LPEQLYNFFRVLPFFPPWCQRTASFTPPSSHKISL
jgi:hypothetical protein